MLQILCTSKYIKIHSVLHVIVCVLANKYIHHSIGYTSGNAISLFSWNQVKNTTLLLTTRHFRQFVPKEFILILSGSLYPKRKKIVPPEAKMHTHDDITLNQGSLKMGLKEPWRWGMGCACHPGHVLQGPGSCAGQWSVQWWVWRALCSVLSPLLFILVLEVLSHEFRTGESWKLFYADDLVLITDTHEHWISPSSRHGRLAWKVKGSMLTGYMPADILTWDNITLVSLIFKRVWLLTQWKNCSFICFQMVDRISRNAGAPEVFESYSIYPSIEAIYNNYIIYVICDVLEAHYLMIIFGVMLNTAQWWQSGDID